MGVNPHHIYPFALLCYYQEVDVQVDPPQQQQEPGANTTVLLAVQVAPTLEVNVNMSFTS
jgi:hypothetical protein